jgi:AcrR family transcriptional regulator
MPLGKKVKSAPPEAITENVAPSSPPQAGLRLAEALKALLKKKNFNSITTAEIAREAQANEALIYRYFKDKRGLLHYLLAEYMRDFMAQLDKQIEGMADPLARLRSMIHGTLFFYNEDLVFAKILLIEVRNYPAYFESTTYRTVQYFARVLSGIIQEGVTAGVFRPDVPVSRIRDVIFGSIEHQFLPKIIFDRDVDIDEAADGLFDVISHGIMTPRA